MSDRLVTDDADLAPPSRNEMLQIMLEFMEKEKSDLTAAHGQRLRELYDLLEAFSAKEGTPGKQAWEEFEETFSIEKGSISSLTLPAFPPIAISRIGQPDFASPASLPLSPASSSSRQPSLPAAYSTEYKQESSATPTKDSIPIPPPQTLAPPSGSSFSTSTTATTITHSSSTDPSGSSRGSRRLPTLTALGSSIYSVPISAVISDALPPSPPLSDVPLTEYAPPLEASTLPDIPLALVNDYARGLYPLPTLPIDQAKMNALRSRRKGGASGGSSVHQPTDLYKWSVVVSLNPLSALVRTARKCLGSSDWETAYNELRFAKAMQRVEQLKQEGRWSFRQPKKQKGPPVAKSHWDWMLEEMKWLQTDFREERRWKTALAFEIGQWILDWHEASTEERRAMCVQVGRPKVREPDEDIDMVNAEAIGEGGFGERVSAVRTGDEDVEMEPPTDGIARALRPSQLGTLLSEDASFLSGGPSANDTVVRVRDETPLVSASATEEAHEAIETALELVEDKLTDSQKVESDDPLHLGDAVAAAAKDADDSQSDAQGTEQDAEGEIDDSEEVIMDDPDATAAARYMGRIPPPEPPAASVLAEPVAAPVAPPLSSGLSLDDKSGPSTVKSNVTLAAATDPLLNEPSEDQTELVRATLREAGPSSLTLDMSSFFAPSSANEDSPADLSAKALAELFGETGVYTMPVPLTQSIVLSGKTDRRGHDEATVQGGKLAHTSRLLDIKPVLVSTLQPAKKRKLDSWEDLSDLWGGGDPFEGDGREPVAGTSSLFAGKKHRDHAPLPACIKPNQPRNSETRLAGTVWLNDDDVVLQRLCQIYPFNWQLISDAFNTSRRTLSIDRRSPWDCFQRWNKKWNPKPETEIEKSEGPTSEPGSIDPATGLTAEASKKGITSNVPEANDPFGGSRKKRRHAKLYDAMKKTAKKRDMANRKPLNKDLRRQITAHNSHDQYLSRGTPPTPGDMNQLKYERELAHAQQIRLAQEQRRQAEAAAIAQYKQTGQFPPGMARPGTNTPPGYVLPPGARQVPVGHPIPTPQQQQARLAAMSAAAAQNGGRPPSANGATAAQTQAQLQLLQAHRQAAARQQGVASPGGTQIGLPPATAPRPGARPGAAIDLRRAKGNSPDEIAGSLVENVPLQALTQLTKNVVINGHTITPVHIRDAILRSSKAKQLVGQGRLP